MSALKMSGFGGFDPAVDKIKEAREARAASSKEKATSPEALEKVAGELESYFMRQILAEAHKSSDDKSNPDGGFAGGTFHDMLDTAMADKMSAGQGLGLKKIIVDSLTRSQEVDEMKGAEVSKIKGDVVLNAISRTRALQEIP